MAVVVKGLTALAGDLTLFHTTDPLLCNSPILIFHGQAVGPVSTGSRHQIHIFTPAGFESYTRLSISPNSAHYAAVTALPREEQGDEICRSIAYALAKYFAELSTKVREILIAQSSATKKIASPLILFTPNHIAVLASRLARISNTVEVQDWLREALCERRLSWLDVDFVLPQNTVQAVTKAEMDLLSDDDLCRRQYGRYAPIISSMTRPDYIPTANMKRRPSRLVTNGTSRLFQVGQQEIIRKEMCELADTESSFVDKVMELIEQIAPKLKACVDEGKTGEHAKSLIETLFPDSLTAMVERHRNFLDDLQEVLDVTDEAAIEAIQNDLDNIAAQDASSGNADKIGIIPFSQMLVKHFPQFETGYIEYMRLYEQSAYLMKQLKESQNEDLMETIKEIGEKHLMSLLIEPVQRLPRYSLYLDTMLKKLPGSHPALSTLLKAKDLITDICVSTDEPLSTESMHERLVNLVEGLSQDLNNSGRFITAVDVMKVDAPYTLESSTTKEGLLLVFCGQILYLESTTEHAPSARAIQNILTSSIDPSYRSVDGIGRKPFELVQRIMVRDFQVHELRNENMICLLVPAIDQTNQVASTTLNLKLCGLYAGKAIELCEEICRARLESRFDEVVREKYNWNVRSARNDDETIGMIVAICEKGIQAHYLGQVRIEVDAKDQATATNVSSSLQTCVRITPAGNTFCHLAIDSIFGSTGTEKVALTDLDAVISRRLAPILQVHYTDSGSSYSAALIARNRDIIEALDLDFAGNSGPVAVTVMPMNIPVRQNRPISPVKQITNFLSSKVNHSMAPVPRRLNSTYSVRSNVETDFSKSMFVSNSINQDRKLQASHSLEYIPQTNRSTTTSSVSGFTAKQLTQNLSTYIVALQARKGNVVGSVIRERNNMNHDKVKVLYEALLVDPTSMTLAAQAPVDVLFAAFESFLNVAWPSIMGQIIDDVALQKLQHNVEIKSSPDFEESFHAWSQGVSSENFRAFCGIVKLLVELLDGASNDGDRGILTTAFAELLTLGRDTNDIISLLDYFVGNMDSLLDEDVIARSLDLQSSPRADRTRINNTGSIGSNSSSFRRKFGFGGGISRENSKTEAESRVGSVWRSLSKNSKTSSETSFQRPVLNRSTSSSDGEVRVRTSGPTLREIPVIHGPFAFERPESKDGSFMPSSPLATIGENVVRPINGQSTQLDNSASSSDLSIIPTPQTSPSSAKSVKNIPISNFGQQKPVSISGKIATPTRVQTPNKSIASAYKKENSPVVSMGPSSIPRPRGSSVQVDEVVITAHSSAKNGTTNIMRYTPSTKLSTRVGLTEKSSANAMKIKPLQISKPTPINSPSSLSSTPVKKMTLQSPQKLRERLQSEQRSLQSVSLSINSEMKKLTDDIAVASSIQNKTATTSPSNLTVRLNTLSQSLNSTISTMQESNQSLQNDTLSALLRSESRTKKLEELYRESSAENDALYKRFNEEIAKVMMRVRSGEGVVELKQRVKSLEEEAEGLRKENRSMKREIIGLKARNGE